MSVGLSAIMLCLAAFRGGAAAAGDAPAGETPPGGMDPQSIAAFRCSQLSDSLACMSALGRRPDDPGLLVAEADALMGRGRPGEAIGVYRHALRAGADRRATTSRIADAETLRKSLLHGCDAGSDAAAESDCEAAWLPGAPDEVHVFKRRGHLLRTAGRSTEALQAYLTAARLAPADHDAARAVVELTETPGAPDPATLMARGKALLTLGRPGDAIVALRQATASEANRVDAERELKRAERAERAQRAERAASSAAMQQARTAAKPDARLAPAGAAAPAGSAAPAAVASALPAAVAAVPAAVAVAAAHPAAVQALGHADKGPSAREPPPSNEAPPTRSN